MRTYRTPGIYFEPNDAAAAVIGPLRTDIAGFVGIASRGPLHTPVKIESLAQFDSVFGGPMPQAYLAYSVQGFFANGGATCWVVRVADPDPAASKPASLDIVDDHGLVLLTLTAGSPGTWGNNILARWMTRGTEIVSVTLHYPGGSEELIRNPLRQPRGANDLQRAGDSLPANRIAPLIEATPGHVPRNAQRVSNGIAWLAGGTDGLATLKAEHITGEGAPPGTRWGLAALEMIDDVSIVAIPDIMPKLRIVPATMQPPPYDCRVLGQREPAPKKDETPAEFPPAMQTAELQEALVRHCEKLQYRIAILDPPDDLAPDLALKTSEPFQTSRFAALYYPWIQVSDPLRLTGLVRAVPPSGAVAGIYARSDRLYGVHKPPANEVVQGALNVKFIVDEIAHGDLNEAGVNVVRPFAGRGIRVYGARTTCSDTMWRYVNVRRLISMIEKAIDKGSQWTVFEPNGAPLRREMDRSIRSYLESLFRLGMLDGADSEAAYSVKCDDDTTPPEAQDAGRVICKVGVQPPAPAEFVVVVIGKTQNAMEILKEGGAIDA